MQPDEHPTHKAAFASTRASHDMTTLFQGAIAYPEQPFGKLRRDVEIEGRNGEISGWGTLDGCRHGVLSFRGKGVGLRRLSPRTTLDVHALLGETKDVSDPHE